MDYGMMKAKGKEKMAGKAKGKKSAPKKMAMKKMAMKKIEAAHKASENLGKPYNGNSMISAEKITPKTATIMKEIGQI